MFIAINIQDYVNFIINYSIPHLHGLKPSNWNKLLPLLFCMEAFTFTLSSMKIYADNINAAVWLVTA